MSGKGPGRAARMVRAARGMRGQRQQDLADLLAELTGTRWTRNNIAAIENGQRKIAADELPSFATVQSVPITWYFDEPGDDSLESADVLKRGYLASGLVAAA